MNATLKSNVIACSRNPYHVRSDRTQTRRDRDIASNVVEARRGAVSARVCVYMSLSGIRELQPRTGSTSITLTWVENSVLSTS
jgi:hypothetical protein